MNDARLTETVDACRALIIDRFPGSSEDGAAAMLLQDGTVVTGTAPEVLNPSVEVCHETEGFCAAYRLGQPVVASVCLHRRTAGEFIVLSPCGVCRERLAVHGPKVLVAVPQLSDPTQLLWKPLSSVLPDYWLTAFPDADPGVAQLIMYEILSTARLRLRRFEESDVDNLLNLYRDGQVMRYLDDPQYDRERIESEVLPQLMADYSRYRRYGYWAAETPGGSFVGRFAFHPVIMADDPNDLWRHAPTDSSEVVSIGYRLIRSDWGNGYALEIGRALLSLTFDEYGAERAVATTMAVNRPSRKVLCQLGFQHTRTVHLDWENPLPGNDLGDVVYELDRADHESSGT